MVDKLTKLKEWFENKESVLIAFSGGVDSALLLKVAQEVLQNKVLAVTANSPLNAPQEKEAAIRVAKEIGANHLIVELDDLKNPQVRANTPERCYYCKKARFEVMLQLAKEKGLEVVVEGSNLDDLKDYRPGLKAVKELGVASPLEEVGFTKKEIRKISQQLGISVWDKPSEPCLATRIPFNSQITKEKLIRIMNGERFIKNEFGLKQIRVRDHNGLARIEVEKEMLTKVLTNCDKVRQALLDEGFEYVTLDLAGYRTGSMNRIGGEN